MPRKTPIETITADEQWKLRRLLIEAEHHQNAIRALEADALKITGEERGEETSEAIWRGPDFSIDPGDAMHELLSRLDIRVLPEPEDQFRWC